MDAVSHSASQFRSDADFSGACRLVLGCCSFFKRLLQVFLLTAGIVLLIGIFIILKVPSLVTEVSGFIRYALGRSSANAAATDLRWLGFSYIAFRLLHTIRDRQTGRLPVVTLPEYVTYVIFFPALTAGPIDRIERFIQELRSPITLSAEDLSIAGKRLMVGLFKKFVLADSLAIIALNSVNALQTRTAGWMWYCSMPIPFRYCSTLAVTRILLSVSAGSLVFVCLRISLIHI